MKLFRSYFNKFTAAFILFGFYTLVGLNSQVYNFTTCGAAGRFGPLQVDCDGAYGPGVVSVVTQGIQRWTIPTTGAYRIEVFGAQGGNDFNAGGLGEYSSGEFVLTSGQFLQIAVGQQGTLTGGGGGSFVVDQANNPLIIAGGGAGGTTIGPGGPGQLPGGAGGGGAADFTGCTAAGGGGFFSDGQSAGSQGGLSFFNGLTGGAGNTCGGGPFPDGGFGGGAGSGYSPDNSAGGGGYTGGNGVWVGVGSGGFSFNSGVNQTNTQFVQIGNGFVVITFLGGTDDCVAATPISNCASSVITGSTVGYTIDGPGTACDGGSVAPDIWYTLTGASGTVTLDMCGSGYDTKLDIFTGSCGALTCLAGDDDAGCGLTSFISFTANPATTYYIRVHGFNGQTGNYTLTTTLSDVIPPVLAACSGDINVNNDFGICGAVVSFATPTATDNCGVPVVSQTAGLPSGSTFPVGSTPVSFAATDAAGNTDICTFNVVVTDNEPPTLTCTGPSYTEVFNIGGADLINLPNSYFCTGFDRYQNGLPTLGFGWNSTNPAIPTSISVSFNYDIECGGGLNTYNTNLNGGPSAGSFTPPDDCGNCLADNIYTFTPSPSDYVPNGFNSFMIDLMGMGTANGLNTSGALGGFYAVVTVTYPSCDIVTTSECGPVTITPPTANDNCAGPITGTTGAPLTYSAEGIYNVTWTFDDGAGNTSTQNEIIILDDVTPPVPDTPGPVAAAFTSAAVPVAVLDLATAVVPVAVSGLPTSLNSGDLTSVCININHTWDGDMEIQLQSPAGTLYDLSMGNGSTGDNYTNTCFDMSAGTPITAGTPPYTGSFVPQGVGGFDVFNGEDPNGTWNLVIFDNANGDVGTVTSFVMNFLIPGGLADFTAECEATPTAPTATDNCAGTINGVPDVTFPITTQGTTVVTWTYDDGNGNITTETQNIVIDDITAPVIDCPAAPITVSNDPGICAAVVNFADPTFTDNCVLPPTPVFLTHSVDQTIIPGGSVSCNAGGLHANNGYFRVFNLPAFGVTNDLDITSVDMGIEQAFGAFGSQPTEVRLYTLSGPLLLSNLTLISNTPYTLNDMGTGIVNIPVTGTIPAGSTLVVEFFTPDGQVDGNSIFVGANNLGQTDPSYIAAADCGITDPLDLALIGFPGMHVVMNVNGMLSSSASITQTAGLPSGSTFPVGSTTITYVADDGNGNSSECSFDVIVEDTEVPVFTDCYADTTAPAVAGLCGRVITYALPTSYTDNCGVVSFTQTDGTGLTSGQIFPVGITNQSFTIVDAAGNSAVCSFNITIVDDQDPMITGCPASDVTATSGANSCDATVTWPAITASDNCPGVTMVSSHNPGSVFPVGTTVVTYTATDASLNTAVCFFNVVVSDVTAPVADVANLDVTSECGPVTVTAPTATDNCAGSVTGTTSDPLTYSAEGSYTVTWTYDDGNGNTSTQIQTVTIDDVTAPVADAASLDVTDECTVTVTPPTATDNCVGSITGTTSDPLTYSGEGTYTVTWTYDDGNGNTTTQTQTITIDDVTAPVADAASLDVTSECGPVTVTAPTATDNCAGTITGTTSDALTYAAQGTFTVTWTYDDGNGNTSTQTQTITIDDVTAPVADAASLDVADECTVTVTAPTATDNCAGTITGTTSDPLTYSAEGVYTVTWTYDDGNGNTTTQTQTVTIDDLTAPVEDVATLPSLSDECTVTLTAPTATDNCAGTITGTTLDPLTYSADGVYTVTWTYDDGNGNTTTQTQTVTIDDVTAPIEDVANIDVTSECDVTLTAPTATDNCVGTITGTTLDPITYSGEGTYTVTWTYDDGNGNTTTQTQTITIDDATAPVADAASLDVTSECGPVTVTAPTATDNCIGSVTGTTADPLTYSTQGTFTVTWTYDDGNGNTSTQTQTVTIEDVTAPVADVANLDVTSECGPVTVTAPTATDNCAGAITGTTADPLTYSTQGTFTVTWTYDDGNGNTSTQTQTVTIDDVTAPVTSAIADASGSCSVTVTAPTAVDACAGTITGTTSDPLTYSTTGTYVVTWTFDDGNGNISTATQNVTVTDNTAPVPDAQLLTNVVGNCTVTVSTIPTATDACSGVINGTTTDPLTYNIPGTYFITWTFDDGNGNIFTQNQTVIVDPCLGINESGEEVGVSIYPNPSNGIFNLTLSTMPRGGAQIKLVDELGQVLFVNDLQNLTQSYDFSYLRAATYYVQIIGNEVNITKTIIITHGY